MTSRRDILRGASAALLSLPCSSTFAESPQPSVTEIWAKAIAKARYEDLAPVCGQESEVGNQEPELL